MNNPPTPKETRESVRQLAIQQCKLCDENGVEAYEESGGDISYRPCNHHHHNQADWMLKAREQ